RVQRAAGVNAQSDADELARRNLANDLLVAPTLQAATGRDAAGMVEAHGNALEMAGGRRGTTVLVDAPTANASVRLHAAAMAVLVLHLPKDSRRRVAVDDASSPAFDGALRAHPTTEVAADVEALKYAARRLSELTVAFAPA